MQSINRLLPSLITLARTAGDAIMDVYRSDFDIRSKTDATPVTAADLAAEAIIVTGLGRLTPDVPVVSEESELPPYAERSQWSRYWLVDPLDGTREFVSRNGEFTVNIAFVEGTAPALGVVHAPARAITYTGCRGLGAARITGNERAQKIRVAGESHQPVKIVGSRSHRGDSLDAWLAGIAAFEFEPLGSALKFCLVAEGSADVYPRFGPTAEWDTAAGQAVAEAAGAAVLKLDGTPLDYNAKEDILNPDFIVIGATDRDWLHFGDAGLR